LPAPFDIPGQAIIDGEVVVIHEGWTNFSELQAELAAGRQDRLIYYAFDLLWLDGDFTRVVSGWFIGCHVGCPLRLKS
jgi:bifunctional non-homologous end joining protein LigD